MQFDPQPSEQIAAGASLDDGEFRLLVESLTDYAILLLDRAGHVASWNAGAARIQGYAAEEVIGLHFSLFYTPEDRSAGRPQEAVLRAARDGRAEEQGWRLRKDGSRFFADVTLTALRDAAGGLRGFANFTRDATGLQKLRENEVLLKDAAQNLGALTRRLVEAQDMERRRMAAELHDRVGQNLSALNINLDIALGMLSGQAAPEVRMRLADSLALVDGTAQAIENVMAELRPPLLEEYGLGAALGSYARDFSRRSGIAVEVDDPDELACGLPPENGIALFRIAQEALNNVARHADAKKARLFFERNGAELVLGIADDGRGFDVAAARLARRARWGLSTMHERAAALGGRLAVDSNPGRGTTVRATVPAGPDE